MISNYITQSYYIWSKYVTHKLINKISFCKIYIIKIDEDRAGIEVYGLQILCTNITDTTPINSLNLN